MITSPERARSAAAKGIACATLCLGLLLGAFAAPASAASAFRATVTHVTDGDTVWVRPASGGAPIAVRLQGLDAPEICQAHGLQAR
ncbi:MAG TPA: hypothetical protein VLJ86_26060, partial [Ramlibacter sp.]|nr:hypothetical protein [Ramlibacter sp.]